MTYDADFLMLSDVGVSSMGNLQGKKSTVPD